MTAPSRAIAVGAVALAAVALSACGSGGSKAASPATSAATSPVSASATTAAAAASSGSSGSSPSGSSSDGEANLNALTADLGAASKATFKAVYHGVSGGQSVDLTLEQKPPASLFETGQGEVISNGTTTDFCSLSGAQKTCFSESGASPLAALTAIFSPQTVTTELKAAYAESAQAASGYHLSFSNASFAGLSAKCVEVSGLSTGKYCVSTNGILAYVGSGADTFTLTSYTTDVPSSDFSLPSGASTQTIPSVTLPSGVTLPPGVTIP